MRFVLPTLSSPMPMPSSSPQNLSRDDYYDKDYDDGTPRARWNPILSYPPSRTLPPPLPPRILMEEIFYRGEGTERGFLDDNDAAAP